MTKYVNRSPMTIRLSIAEREKAIILATKRGVSVSSLIRWLLLREFVSGDKID